MTAKEFDRKFWKENDPISTPLWKAMEAYHIFKLAEIGRLDNSEKIVNVKFPPGGFSTKQNKQ